MPTAQVSRSVSGIGSTLTINTTATAGLARDLEEAIPDGSANLPVAFELDVSQTKLFAISADQAISVFTNDLSSGTPDDTLVLVANGILLWVEGDPASGLPITVDITAGLFVTNASGADATLIIKALEDPTV